MSLHVPMYIMVFVSFLTWLVFVITANKIYKFFVEFEKFKGKNDAELNHAVWSLNKIQEALPEVVAHLERMNGLLFDIYKGRELSEDKAPQKDTDVDYAMDDLLRHKHDLDEKLAEINKAKEQGKNTDPASSTPPSPKKKSHYGYN